MAHFVIRTLLVYLDHIKLCIQRYLNLFALIFLYRVFCQQRNKHLNPPNRNCNHSNYWLISWRSSFLFSIQEGLLIITTFCGVLCLLLSTLPSTKFLNQNKESCKRKTTITEDNKRRGGRRGISTSILVNLAIRKCYWSLYLC